MTAPARLRQLVRQEVRAAQFALSFLTTLPVPHLHDLNAADVARASRYYPLAGYAVGGGMALLLWLPLPLPAGVRAAFGLAAWLALSGMLHFDGLVDSADALFATKTPAQRLEILRDVHVGAFGLAAGVLVLLSLWSVLSANIPPFAPVVAAVVARALLLLPMRLYPAARAGSLGDAARGGSARGSSAQGGGMSRGDGMALLLALPTLLVPGGWRAWLAALVVTLLAGRFAATRLGGGLNGDTYGMMVVVSELAALCAFAWGLTGSLPGAGGTP